MDCRAADAACVQSTNKLYLIVAAQAKEGVIAEGSPAWEEMSQQDKNKRKRAAGEPPGKLPGVHVRSCTAGTNPTWIAVLLLACCGN